MPKTVTLTLNPTVDKSSTVEQIVAEHKMRCSTPRYHPGGGGLNVSRAMHRLGGQSTAFWMKGGSVGQLLNRLLDDEGIDHQPIAIEAMTRENLIVYEKSSEHQYRFGMPGAELKDAEVASCIDRLQQIDPAPDYLVLSGSLPPGVADDIYAKIAGAMPTSCRVVLDTSGQPLRFGLEGPIYLVKPNIRELGELAGQPIEGDQQIREAASSLVADGKVQVVVVSLGSAGVILVTRDGAEHVRAPTVKIRSKVGAGDSTVAGVVLALERGKAIREAVRFGVAAGAAAVMTSGTELCRRSDAERLFEEAGQFVTHEREVLR